ncbi:MAG: hypothetical protein ABI871_05595 [Chthoniobacterales bacterium]
MRPAPASPRRHRAFAGIFWAYDGTPSLCAPPRLYNQITVQIGDQTHLAPIELARLLALVNVAMAGAGFSVRYAPFRRKAGSGAFPS